MSEESSFFGFAPVPQTGVNYVLSEAIKAGFVRGNAEWINIGPGCPETGSIDSLPSTLTSIAITEENSHYAPVAGIRPLREAVAKMYNVLYREGKTSKYTFENVCICPGGRAALVRVLAAMTSLNLGHFIPDYYAFEKPLNLFCGINPVPIFCEAENGFHIPASTLRDEIKKRGLSAVFLSNPNNPTGVVIEGEELAEWVRMARECRCTFILDEMYSNFIYSDVEDVDTNQNMVSAAKYVEDVDADPVLLLDGLTKSWRLPGFRCGWVVGPKRIIEAVSASGTSLDGGANHAIQQAVVPYLDPEFVRNSTVSLQAHFRHKRDYLLSRLSAMGLNPRLPLRSTFYAWICLDNLPSPLNNGEAFFQECLKEKVIVVPGFCFDINPGQRRSRYRLANYVRISFGPEMHTLEQGLDAIERVVRKHTSPIPLTSPEMIASGSNL